MNNDDKKKEMMGFVHEGKASLRSTAMGIKALRSQLIKEKLSKVRSENEDDSIFLSHNFSDDFIRAMHNQYIELRQSPEWDIKKIKLEQQLNLPAGFLDKFTSSVLKIRGGKCSMVDPEKDIDYEKGKVIYSTTLNKLAEYFKTVSCFYLSPDQSFKLTDLLEVDKIHFTDCFQRKAIASVKEKIKAHKIKLYDLRIELNDLKREKDVLDYMSEADALCSKLISEFEIQRVYIYGGQVNKIVTPKDSNKASVLIISAISPEDVKRLNAKSRSSTVAENVPLMLTTNNWDDVSFETLEETKEKVSTIHEITSRQKAEIPHTEEAENLKKIDTISSKQASIHLKRGGIIAHATEGVFGLSCDAESQEAVQNLIELKERSQNKGLIITSGDLSHLIKYFHGSNMNYLEESLKMWREEPTTVLIPKNEHAHKWLTGEHPTIALRLSSHNTIKEVTSHFDSAIVSTSANLSGEDTAKSLEDVDRIFSDKVLLVEGRLGGLSKPTRMFNFLTREFVRS